MFAMPQWIMLSGVCLDWKGRILQRDLNLIHACTEGYAPWVSVTVSTEVHAPPEKGIARKSTERSTRGRREKIETRRSVLKKNLKKNKKKARRRCGECTACKRADCRACKYCLDKPKFGGSDTLRRCCQLRECKRKATASPRKRCGKCVPCKLTDCGVCKYCLDKPKFGGSDTLRRSCLQRKCKCRAALSAPRKCRRVKRKAANATEEAYIGRIIYFPGACAGDCLTHLIACGWADSGRAVNRGASSSLTICIVVFG